MEGKIDYFFIGAGTGGSCTGIAKALKQRDSNIKIVAIDPHGSTLALPEELNTDPFLYKIEGIGQDEVPGTLEREYVDYWVKVSDKESFVTAREIMKSEGIFCGGSCGSVLIGMNKFLKQQKLD